MAANLQSRGLAIFGKRFVGQIVSCESVTVVPAAVFSLRTGVHTKTYDKNLEEHVQATVVPDNVIPPDQSEKYWGPHPETGVFGPASDHHKPTASAGVHNSVLEEKAFFRPLEDLDKPQQP